MESSLLMCSVCASALPGDAVDEALAVARCPECHALFDLSGRKGAALSKRPAAPERASVPLPQQFQVEDRGHEGMTIQWRWFRPFHIFQLAFCVAWDSFLLFWYMGALNSPSPDLMTVIFPIAHVTVGVGLTYATLAGFVNNTQIAVSRQRLQIRHGPLPWRGQLDVGGSELAQLYGQLRESTGRRDGDSMPRYELCAIDREGKKRTLLRGLTEPEQVLWLEQALERHLGIEDRPVAGELGRKSA